MGMGERETMKDKWKGEGRGREVSETTKTNFLIITCLRPRFSSNLLIQIVFFSYIYLIL